MKEQSTIAERAALMIRERITRQGGVPTYYDNYVRQLIRTAETHSASVSSLTDHARQAVEQLTEILAFTARPRFCDPVPRLRRDQDQLIQQMGVGWVSYKASQGVKTHLEWAGRPLFKTVYDLAAYPMLLVEQRPQTIIELGTGSGASSVWMADTANCHGLSPTIISIDRRAVSIKDSRVRFIEGDISRIEDLLPPEITDPLLHPWLVIEDAHAHIGDVLAFFHDRLTAGDYLIIEDSLPKRAELLSFAVRTGAYWLDTRYVDLFGENTTCAIDSIYKRK